MGERLLFRRNETMREMGIGVFVYKRYKGGRTDPSVMKNNPSTPLLARI